MTVRPGTVPRPARISRSPVGRAVVDHDDLAVERQGDAAEPVEHGREGARLVEDRHDDGQQLSAGLRWHGRGMIPQGNRESRIERGPPPEVSWDQEGILAPHVVIVGGGFGGLHAARALGGARGPRHAPRPPQPPPLPAAALPGGDRGPVSRATSPRRSAGSCGGKRNLAGAARRRATRIDPARQPADPGRRRGSLVRLPGRGGRRRPTRTSATTSGRGLRPASRRWTTPCEIRRRMLLAFERAERANDPEERRRLLTFAIVGGGPTGVELAGAAGGDRAPHAEAGVQALRAGIRPGRVDRSRAENPAVVSAVAAGGVGALAGAPGRGGLEEQAGDADFGLRRGARGRAPRGRDGVVGGGCRRITPWRGAWALPSTASAGSSSAGI